MGRNPGRGTIGQSASAPVNVSDANEMERDVAEFARGSDSGLIVTSSPSAALHRDLIVTLAARHRLPAVYYQRVVCTAAVDLMDLTSSTSTARGRLRRSHPQGRETRRSSSPGTDQV